MTILQTESDKAKFQDRETPQELQVLSSQVSLLIHLDLAGRLCNLVILRWILEIELSYWNTECWIFDKASLIVNSRSAWHHLPTLTVVVVRPYPSTLLDTRPVSLLPPSNQHLCIKNKLKPICKDKRKGTQSKQGKLQNQIKLWHWQWGNFQLSYPFSPK